MKKTVLLCAAALAFGMVGTVLPAAEKAAEAQAVVKPELNPDWNIQLKGRKIAAGKLVNFKTPAIPDIYAYVPVFSFELKINGKDNKAVMPVLQVNNRPYTELDKWDAPRLMNRKNSKDGGNGLYVYNVSGLLRPGKYNRFIVKLNDSKTACTISNVRVFLKPDSRSVVPDAPAKEKNVFKIVQGNPLKITLNGKDFIVSETFEKSIALDKLKTTCHEVKNSAGEITAHNMYRLKDPVFDFRREAALYDNGELELTFRGSEKRYSRGKDSYGFRVPMELLDGAEYKVWVSVLKCVTGKVDIKNTRSGGSIFADPKDGTNFYNIKYVQFKKGDLTLNFDFVPASGSSGSPYCNSPTQAPRGIIRSGKHIVFQFPKHYNPDRMTNIVRIFCGEQDFHHRNGLAAASRWSSGPHCNNLGHAVSFADTPETLRRNSQLIEMPGWQRDHMMPFQSSTVNKEIPGVVAGWRKLPEGYTHFSKGPFFPVAAGMALADDKVAEYALPLPSGFYLVGLIAGDYRRDVGPLTVKFNGEVAFKDVKIKAGHYRQLVAYVFLRAPEKEMRITFEGKNVSLNQLIVRPDMSQNQDYVLTRGYWKTEGLPEFGLRIDSATVVPRKKDVLPVVMGADVLPEVAAVAMKLSDQAVNLPEPSKAPDPDKNYKIWNTAWVDLNFFSGNRDSGLNEVPDEYYEKHFAELKKLGINGVTEEGLFWYNVYDDETKIEHGKRQRHINDIAHKYGIDIVRHADNPVYTLLNSVGNMGKYPGAFMSDCSSLRVVRALYCLNNPKFRKDSIENLVRYIKMTDCDIMMVDDQHGTFNAYRCFCAYCREAFTRDTGCILPMPDQMKEFYTTESPLRARWQHWQQYQEGKYLNELRAAAKKVKPSIKFTNYGVDFRLALGHLHGIAPYLDVFGVELAAADVYSLHYRFYMAHRKLILALGEAYDRPVWLLYSDRKDITDPVLRRYSTWAMASLARSGVDYFGWTIKYDNLVPDWPERMDFRYKTTLSNVAILNREDSRYNYELKNFSEAPLYEQNGISQLLAKKFVPHEFITPKSLKDLKKLAKWELIIAGDVDVMEKAELEVLRKYVANGGKLLITGRFAGVDSLYRQQDANIFSDVTGVEYKSKLLKPGKGINTANKKWSFPTENMKIVSKTAKVVATFPDGTPAVTVNKFGKGLCVVSAAAAARKNGEMPHSAAFKLGKVWQWKEIPEVEEFMQFLLKSAEFSKAPYSVQTAEEHVLVEACSDTKTDKVYFQVLRVPRSKVEFGKPTKPLTTTFAELAPAKNPVVITTAFKVKSAYASSPRDFAGKKDLPVKQLPDGGSQITLDGKLLKVYNLITVDR